MIEQPVCFVGYSASDFVSSAFAQPWTSALPVTGSTEMMQDYPVHVRENETEL
jgi:hypothetical protein